MGTTKPHILLTGGTGLLGAGLTNALLEQGHRVSHLSRSPGKNPRVQTFLWNVPKGQIDPHCTDGIDVIIHLAGASVADKRWTAKRKREIIDSRVDSIRLIYQLLAQQPHQVSRVISASGISYYGNCGDEVLEESHPPAHDFLAQCCIEWENAVDEGESIGLKTVKMRTGVVLTKEGGALTQMALPVKLGVGSPLGSGKQWVPWIHYADAINMYLHAIAQSNLTGTYNMAAPQPVTNKDLTKAIAKQLKRPLWLPNVPAFVLRLLVGEMASMITDSVRTSARKIEQTGFVFKHPEIVGALREIYNTAT